MTHKKEEWGNIQLPGLSDDELYKTNWNKVAHAQTKIDNPEFSETMRGVASQRDEKYHTNLKEGIANRDNTYQAECNSRPEVKAKISRSLTAVPKSDSHKANLRAVKTNKYGNADYETKHKAGLAKRDREFHAGKYGTHPSLSAAGRYAKSQGLPNAIKKFEEWKTTDPTNYYFIDKHK